mgnify:CR=1 FL=1|jgi:hypothetical protein
MCCNGLRVRVQGVCSVETTAIASCKTNVDGQVKIVPIGVRRVGNKGRPQRRGPYKQLVRFGQKNTLGRSAHFAVLRHFHDDVKDAAGGQINIGFGNSDRLRRELLGE